MQQPTSARLGATAAALQPGLAMGGKALADGEDAGLRQSNLRRDGTIVAGCEFQAPQKGLRLINVKAISFMP